VAGKRFKKDLSFSSDMHSRISYLNPDRKGMVGINSSFISYCLESPVDVLREVFPSHRIYRYCDIDLPIDSFDDDDDPSSRYGLIIRQARGPRGTEIVQGLSGISLKVAEAELRAPRNMNDMREVFRNAIAVSMSELLDTFGTAGNYLDVYEMRQEDGTRDPFYERKVQQLLDIAKVAFKVDEPDIGYLRQALKK